jgi:di/tricarboxylate transporter
MIALHGNTDSTRLEPAFISWKGQARMTLAFVILALTDLLVNSVGALGPVVLMAGILVLASGFSHTISNVAATTLISTVAFQAGMDVDVSPYPSMMMVDVGVVTGILTPVAAAPLLIVMNPGGYGFYTHARVGFPLLILIFIVSLILLPLIRPL